MYFDKIHTIHKKYKTDLIYYIAQYLFILKIILNIVRFNSAAYNYVYVFALIKEKNVCLITD